MYAGGSSGGAVCGAVRWVEQTKFEGNVVVIICDSAVRYLSKIFNDTWMKEGGYLNPEIGEETVLDLLNRRPMKLISTSRGETIQGVVSLMKEHGISQLPVLDKNGSLEGLISERDLLAALIDERATPQTEVDAFITNNFALVEVTNRTSLVSELLAQGKVVVVEKRGKVMGILTNIDFIDWFSSRLRP